MAFPVNASIGTDTETTDDTSQIITLPATINAGDMILVILTVDSTGALTWPGGWTAVTNYNAASSGARHEAQYKFADGSEGGTTITVTSASAEKSSARIHIITGADTVAPPEAATLQNTTNVAPDPPALSPSWGALDTLWIAGWTSDGGSGTVSGTPSGYSGFAQTSEGTVGGTRTASGWRQANTATEDPGAVTGTSTTARAFTIAIKPVGFPDAGIATGTGAAAAVFANVAPNAEVATGTGQAQDPVVSLDALTYAQPPTITASGTASNASVKVSVNAGLASGTGTAHDATGTTLAQVTRTGGTSSVFASATTSPQTVAFTLPAGSNYLVAMVSTFSSVTISSMTWKPDSGNAGADQAMSLIATSGSDFTGAGTAHIWGLANPTATVLGSLIEHSLSSATKRVMGVHSLGGVNSIGPPAAAAASDDLSVVVDSTAKGLVLDVLRGANSTGTYTANTGQTERWDTGTSGGTNNLRGTGSQAVGNYPTVTMGWATPATTVALLAVSFDASVTVDAEIATGTGQAYDATASTAGGGTSVNAELASGTGSALDASTAIKPNAGASTGTGSAAGPTPAVSVNAGLATGTGSALAVTPSVLVSAEAASGTGAAYDATVSLALSVNAGLASGTGDALAASASVAPNVESTAGTGTAYDATVSTATTTNAYAEVASGTGAAGATTAHVAVNAGLASGTGTALDATATAENEVAAETASGMGAAYPTSVLIAPRSGLGSGTGTAHNATADTSVEISGSFGLDAEISLPLGTHDRRELHFGTQEDTTITTREVLGPLPAGTTLDVVLAYLYDNVPEALHPSFGLSAVIYDESTATFGLNAYIGDLTEDTFSLAAIIERPQLFNDAFGLDAYILTLEDEPWNLVRTPIEGTATYTASSFNTGASGTNNYRPEQAADGASSNSGFGDFWRVATAGAIGDWWQVTWTLPQTINRVIVYDGNYGDWPSSSYRFGNTGTVEFSDGSSVPYSGLNDTFLVLDFAPRSVTWLRVVSASAGGANCSLTEVEAFNTDQWEG